MSAETTGKSGLHEPVTACSPSSAFGQVITEAELFSWGKTSKGGEEIAPRTAPKREGGPPSQGQGAKGGWQ